MTRTLILITIILCFVTKSFCQDRMINVLTGKYLNDIDAISGDYSINDATELEAIACEQSIDANARMSAVKIMDRIPHPDIFQYKKSLESALASRMLSKILTNSTRSDKSYDTDLHVRESVLSSIANSGNDQAADYIIQCYESPDWNKKSVTKNQRIRIDDQLKSPLLFALAKIASKKPSLFSYLEKELQTSTNPLRDNLKDAIRINKEKYFMENPNALKGKGYEVIFGNSIYYSIFGTLESLGRYFQLKKRPPEQLLDLTIKKGGCSYYLFGDKYSNENENLLYYKMINGIQNGHNCWTIIVLSVGPNHKIDIDLSKLFIGLTTNDSKNVFTNNVDDIYELVNYRQP